MKTYHTKPVLNVGESCIENGGGAYVKFDEEIEFHGLKRGMLSLHFENAQTFEDVQEIVAFLKAKGLKLAITG